MKNFFAILCMTLMTLYGLCQQNEKADTTGMSADTLSKKTSGIQSLPDSTAKAAQPVAKQKENHTATQSAVHGPEVTTFPSSGSRREDSLKVVNDSLSKNLNKYYKLYTIIKEKVIKHDFDPLRMSKIIDSLYSHRDSMFSSSSLFLRDSLAILKKEIAQLKLNNDSLSVEDIIVARYIRELKLLKDLLDSSILTQSEFDIRKAAVLSRWQMQ